MPKARTIDETPDNHHTFLECGARVRESAADDVPGGNERPRPCRCDSSLFMTATPYLLWVFGKKRCVACDAFHRVALFHVARFDYPFVKLYPMLDAFCSSEFFRETLDGARRLYLN